MAKHNRLFFIKIESSSDGQYQEDTWSAGGEMASLCGGGTSEEKLAVTEKPRLTGILFLTALGISTGSFQYGYNLSVLNEPYQVIWGFMNGTEYDKTGHFLTDEDIRAYWSAIVSVFSLGGAVGASLTGWWALTFGRKRGCLCNTVLGFIATALLVLSPTFQTYHSLIVGRFIMGVHAGLYTGLCPLYLNEISTPSTRGPLGIVHQTGTVVGLLVAQLLGFPVLLGSGNKWIDLLGFAVVPLGAQIILLVWCPESPRYIAKVQKDELATRDALRRLRGTFNVDEELLALVDNKETVTQEKSCWELLQMPGHRTKLLVAIVVMMSPHLAGSIAVTFYSSLLFEAAGADTTEAEYETSGVGAILVIMSVCSIWLVNRTGRRRLLLLGLAVMATSSVAIVVLQYFQLPKGNVAAVLVFILGFALGPGPIPFTVVPELFPADVKRSALSISVACNWLANFSIGFAFPHIHARLGYLTFSVFAASSSLLFAFLFFLLPETRPGPLEDLSFSYHSQGEDFSQAARASLSIDLDSTASGSHTSKEGHLVDHIRQGFSASAIIGSGDDSYDKSQVHARDLSKRKSRASRRQKFYEPRHYVWHHHRSRSESHQRGDVPEGNHYHDGVGGAERSLHIDSDDGRQRSSDVRNFKGRADLSRSFATTDKSSRAGEERSTREDELVGSENSGFTSLMNSTNDEQTQSVASTETNASTWRPYHVTAQYDSAEELIGRLDHDVRDNERPGLAGGDARTRRPGRRHSASVYETWTESCDADVEAD